MTPEERNYLYYVEKIETTVGTVADDERPSPVVEDGFVVPLFLGC